jgi:hypothetical protein
MQNPDIAGTRRTQGLVGNSRHTEEFAGRKGGRVQALHTKTYTLRPQGLVGNRRYSHSHISAA